VTERRDAGDGSRAEAQVVDASRADAGTGPDAALDAAAMDTPMSGLEALWPEVPVDVLAAEMAGVVDAATPTLDGNEADRAATLDGEPTETANAVEASFLAGEAGVEVARIRNSGSANRPAVQVIVYADASAVRMVESRGTIPDSGEVPNFVTERTYPAGSPFIIQFMEDLAAAGDVALIPTVTCAKSVSFGSTTEVTAGGRTSGDLQCASKDVTPAQAALIQDCELLTF
jgi:hypothetical protein